MKYIVKNRRWRIHFALLCIHEKPVPATVLPNNLHTETKTSDCTHKEIYVEIIKMSSPSQNITSYPSNFQGTPAMPMPMGYEQFHCRQRAPVGNVLSSSGTSQ